MKLKLEGLIKVTNSMASTIRDTVSINQALDAEDIRHLMSVIESDIKFMLQAQAESCLYEQYRLSTSYMFMRVIESDIRPIDYFMHLINFLKLYYPLPFNVIQFTTTEDIVVIIEESRIYSQTPKNSLNLGITVRQPAYEVNITIPTQDGRFRHVAPAFIENANDHNTITMYVEDRATADYIKDNFNADSTIRVNKIEPVAVNKDPEVTGINIVYRDKYQNNTQYPYTFEIYIEEV